MQLGDLARHLDRSTKVELVFDEDFDGIEPNGYRLRHSNWREYAPTYGKGRPCGRSHRVLFWVFGIAFVPAILSGWGDSPLSEQRRHLSKSLALVGASREWTNPNCSGHIYENRKRGLRIFGAPKMITTDVATGLGQSEAQFCLPGIDARRTGLITTLLRRSVKHREPLTTSSDAINLASSFGRVGPMYAAG